MTSAEQLASEHRFFAELEGAFRPLVGSCAQKMRFEPGSYLFHEGDAASWLYLVIRGCVALEVSAPGRGRMIFQTLQGGDVLGMLWLMPHGRWPHDARAVDATEVIAIGAACLREKSERDPAFGYDLLKRFVPILLQRLESAQLQMLDVYGQPK